MNHISNAAKSYGVASEAIKSYSEDIPEDFEADDSEYGYGPEGDSFIPGEEESESQVAGSASVEELEEQLAQMEKSVKANPDLDPKVRKGLLKEIDGAQQQLGFARFKHGQEKENILLAIAALLPQIEQDLSSLPALSELSSEITALIESIQKDFPGEKQKELETLGKLAGQLDLNQDISEESLENIREQLTEIKEQCASDLDTKTTEKSDSIAEMKSDLDQIATDLKNGSIPGSRADEIEARVEDLKAKLEDPAANIEELRNAVKDLKDDVAKEGERGKLVEKFNGLSSAVPNDGYGKDRTRDLAAAVTKAVKNDNWGPVKAMLADLSANHGQEANNAIRQLVGTLYYRVAGEDESELKKLLQCIPTDVLQLMSAEARGHGEANENDYAETEGKKAQYCYYGTGAETADFLDTVAASAE